MGTNDFYLQKAPHRYQQVAWTGDLGFDVSCVRFEGLCVSIDSGCRTSDSTKDFDHISRALLSHEQYQNLAREGGDLNKLAKWPLSAIQP